MRPDTGAPYVIINSTAITWMCTGAVSAVGAKYLACRRPRVLANIGARNTSWYNVAMLDALFDFVEFRVTSRRAESRQRFGDRMSNRLGKTVLVKDSAADVVRDADIIIDASRLMEHEVLVPDAALRPGALLQPYGSVMSVDPSLPYRADKFIVDDWNQCEKSGYGQFATLINAGELRAEHVYAEIGEVVAGLKLGRLRARASTLYSTTRALRSATSWSDTWSTRRRGRRESAPCCPSTKTLATNSRRQGGGDR